MNTDNPMDDLFDETKIVSAPDEIGTPEEDALFNPGAQERADSCAIKVQQHVLSIFGIDTTETDLVNDAMLHGEYGNSEYMGTGLDDVGNLLERNGIEVNRYEGATMAHLISELGQGHKVIVGVDAYEMIADTPEKQFAESQRDLVAETPNHAILVTNVDPYTLDVDIVDPLDGQMHTVSAIQFSGAWKDSNFFMVSTVQSPREYLDEWANQQSQDEEQIGNSNLTNEGERAMFENNGMNYIDTTGNGIANIIESDPDHNGLVENLAIDVDGDTIPDITIQSSPGLQRIEPSLGGLGHVSGYDAAEVEPSLGGLGHVSGYDGPQNFDVTTYDTDGSGIEDTVGIDIGQDGHMDIIASDFDGDSILDAVGLDLDMDNIPEIIGVDLDTDGVADIVSIDIDGDGVMDTTMSADDFNSMFFEG